MITYKGTDKDMKCWRRMVSENVHFCESCGQEWPTYQIYDINGVCLGCEACLTIKKEGRIVL